ncbi:hypothetical protein PHYPSEUDO_012053 [Phytophthora pseudosyringae]|uniref:Uncharacterized protein n=1 Tax=Phytophthora pseudosyringae TaxID=221518 RepID=A0A8T1V886_9STRA|nr:hypothetical protein PHYPSEUDO_012053 [Phytophthora pseudosyringae]
MLQAMQADEAKRARQRKHVKNSYYRKQNVMKALRQEVSELEQEYSRTLQLKQQQMEWREVEGALGYDEERNHSDDLVEQYMQLSIKKQQLVQENKELALMGASFAKLQLKTQHLLDSEPMVALEPPPITVNDVALESMTVPECHEIASQAFKEIEDFMESNRHLTAGLGVFGWREQRREAPDHVKFTLKKRFVGAAPLDMSARAWRVVSSPRGLAGLYSSTMHLSMKVLQVVDDYNVIMYRVITNTSTMETVQSVFLVSRFRMNTGYVILFRSVDRNRLRKLHPDGTTEAWDAHGGSKKEDKWLDMFTWTLFEDEPGNGNAVVFSYGGIVYGSEAVNTRMWMLEILSLALRWENKVVGPTLMLSN